MPSNKKTEKPSDKNKKLNDALKMIRQKYDDDGAVMRMGDQEIMDIEAISTGSIGLDIALGIGGIPKGRVVEIFGPESSGKTTLTLQIIAECQKQGGTAAFIDAEHALDPSYAKALGVYTDDLLLSQPESGEQALEITDMLVKSESLDLIVIDSVAALTSKAEIEGEMGDSHVGLLARLMAQALRKLTANMDKLKTTVIFINQIRDNIGGFGYGNSQVTPGGKALKFFSSVRLDIRRIGTVKGKGEEVIGNETRVKVVKNKVSPPFKQAEFQIIYGEGISNEGEILDMAVKQGLVEKRGAFFRLEDEAIGQGKANARQFLKDNKKIKNSLAREVKKNLLQSKKS